jgi:predicted transglutaminase-like cysteine proteinase
MQDIKTIVRGDDGRSPPAFPGLGPAARRSLFMAVATAFLMLGTAGNGAAAPNQRPSDPFGKTTVKELAYEPLAETWSVLRKQIQLDDLIVSSCSDTETDECVAAKKLMSVVDDARQYQGRAIIGHINRSINLMIKSSEGGWTSALDTLKLGSGDCKDYSIAKYAALLRAGVSPAHVRLIIVHDTARNEHHMVVGVYEDGHWLLMDNLTMLLVKDIDRRGYDPEFVLDETGVRRFVSPVKKG